FDRPDENRGHGEILIIWNGWRHQARQLEPFAPGLPLVFKLLPRAPAPPIFLGVKERDNCDHARQPNQSASHDAPGNEPAQKTARCGTLPLAWLICSCVHKECLKLALTRHGDRCAVLAYVWAVRTAPRRAEVPT